MLDISMFGMNRYVSIIVMQCDSNINGDEYLSMNALIVSIRCSCFVNSEQGEVELRSTLFV